MKFFSVCILFLACLTSQAANTPLSAFPQIDAVATNDDLWVNKWTGSNYVSSRANVGVLVKAVLTNLSGTTIDTSGLASTSYVASAVSGLASNSVGSSQFTNVGGYDNLAVGESAMAGNSGGGNAVFGKWSLMNNGAGNFNTVFGFDSAQLGGGSFNTFLGYAAGNHGYQKQGVVNSTGIGYGTYTTADNQVVIGNENVVQTVIRGVITGDGSGISNLWPFTISNPSWLSVNVSGGKLAFFDGSVTNIAAGVVTLQPSTTNYVSLNLYDKSIHAWKRSGDRGSVLLGTVTTSATGVLNIIQPNAFTVPPSRISRTRAKLDSGQPVRILLLGDSTTQGSGSRGGSNWFSLLFSASMTNQAVSLGKTNITVVNMGVGGQVAKWGLACLGNTVFSPYRANVDFPYWGMSKNQYINSENAAPTNGIGESPLLSPKPDLAIISFGANASTNSVEELAFIESAIARLRKRDIEVILWNGYYRNGFASIQNAQFDRYQSIADWQGCEYVDTFSRLEETNRDSSGSFTGVTYGDNDIHQNNSGHIATAAAIKSLFSVPQAPICPAVPQTRLLLNVQSNWFPNCADVEFYAANGTWNALINRGSAASAASLGPMIGGLATNSASYIVGAGSNVQFNFSRALSADVFFSSANTATLSAAVSGGGWSKSISVPNQSWGGLLSIISMNEMKAVDLSYGPSFGTNWSIFPNWAFRSTFNNTVNIEAAIAYTYDGYVVPWNQMQFAGTWGTEASCLDVARLSHYSDDVGNAAVVIPFTGNGLVVYVDSSKAAGTLTGYIDGNKAYSAYDACYNVAVTNLVHTLQFWPGNYPGKLSDNYGPHTVRLELMTNLNGSAISPVAHTRRLGIYEAYSVDAR